MKIAILEHPFLQNKGQKIHVGKFQAPIAVNNRTLEHRYVKRFCFTIAAMKGGFLVVDNKPDKAAPAASSAASSSKESVVIAAAQAHGGNLTLKQQEAGALRASTKNQLSHAALMYGNGDKFNKLAVSTQLLESIAHCHSEQARQLRSILEIIIWELRQLKGGIQTHIVETMSVFQDVKKYQVCGISRQWPDSKQICIDDLEVSCSDSLSMFMWSLVSVAIVEQETRILFYLVDPKKRFALMMDEDKGVRDQYIADVKLDMDIYKKLSEFKLDWSDDVVRASPFNKMCVKQVCYCMEKDGWIWTPRLSIPM